MVSGRNACVGGVIALVCAVVVVVVVHTGRLRIILCTRCNFKHFQMMRSRSFCGATEAQGAQLWRAQQRSMGHTSASM